jgi:hypothetical protein
MNSVILGSIADMLKARERAKLYESFTLLGGDADSDVEFAFAAQKEAVGD